MDQNIKNLFQNAQAEGVLSNAAAKALMVPDIGAQIQAGLGTNVDDVKASEVILLAIMPDDSGSIDCIRGGAQLMRDGGNLVIDAVKNSKQQDNILAMNRYLNGKLLYPFVPIDQAKRMDGRNYQANGGTPLYDQMIVFLGTLIIKAQEFADNGVPARAIALVITDGRDEHSLQASAADVKRLVKDLQRTERCIIAGMGIDDGNTMVNFREVFKEMGIEDKWILTPASDPSEIRKAFEVFSRSAIRASKSAASFSQTAMGGFNKP